MAYDEEQARQSRVVVETPTARREVVHSQSVRTPDRSGASAGLIGVLVVVVIALITMLVLFWINSQQASDQNANMVAQQPPTVVQQVPAQQPPVIIQQQPAPVTQPAPIVISPPAGDTTEPKSSANDDVAIQTDIDKRLSDDPTFSSLGITATVLNGKVTLLGTVKTEILKGDIEKMVRQIKGVKAVDNQITVLAD